MTRNDEQYFTDLAERLAIDDAPRAEHQRQIRDRVLAEFDRAKVDARPDELDQMSGWQRVLRHPLPRIAAVLLVAAGVIFVSMFSSTNSGSIAFADLVEPIVNARTAVFNLVVRVPDQPVQTVKAMVLEPNRMRQEIGDVVNIMDFNHGRMISLFNDQKKAMIIDMTNRPEQMPANFFGQIRQQLLDAQDKPDVKREPLGERLIDGRRAIGYRIEDENQIMELWGDPLSGLPIRIESRVNMTPGVEVTMSGFEFNVALDESLFSMDPPEGYSVQTLEMDVSDPTEQDLVDALRAHADLNNGDFGKALNMEAINDAFRNLAKSKDNPPDDARMGELMQLGMVIGRGFTFANRLPADADAHYAGDGVKLNEPDRPIFWYRPDDSDAYRVIYADLSVREQAEAPIIEGAERIK